MLRRQPRALVPDVGAVEAQQVVADAVLLVGGEPDRLAQLEHPVLPDAEPGAAHRDGQAVGHLAPPGPAADAVTGLEHDDLGATLDQPPSGRQPGEAGADDAHVCLLPIHARPSSTRMSYTTAATSG